MQFTGRNLELVVQALRGAIFDVQSQIGSCPDVNDLDNIDALDALEEEQQEFERMLERIYKRHPGLRP